MSAVVSIEVSLVLGVWQRDVRDLVHIQLQAVQVACWSDWILRRISSALHTVNRCCGCYRCVFTFHCFPSFSICCHFDPCVVVLYFISFRLFRFLWLKEGVHFIFPSLFFWSFHWSVCLVLGAEAWVPFCGFLLPMVRLVPMQFSLRSAVSFFCAFQSSMGFGLLSSFQLLELCFFSCIQSNLLLQFRLCQITYRCLA